MALRTDRHLLGARVWQKKEKPYIQATNIFVALTLHVLVIACRHCKVKQLAQLGAYRIVALAGVTEHKRRVSRNLAVN
jgi:hypothetical protein